MLARTQESRITVSPAAGGEENNPATPETAWRLLIKRNPQLPHSWAPALSGIRPGCTKIHAYKHMCTTFTADSLMTGRNWKQPRRPPRADSQTVNGGEPSPWVHARSVVSDPVDCSPPGPSARGISQARVLERVAISFSRGSFWPRDRTRISSVSCAGRRVLYSQQSKGRDYKLWTHTNSRELCWVIKDNSERSHLARFHLYHILEIMKSQNWRKDQLLPGQGEGEGWQWLEKTTGGRLTVTGARHLHFLNTGFLAVLLLCWFYKTSPCGGAG